MSDEVLAITFKYLSINISFTYNYHKYPTSHSSHYPHFSHYSHFPHSSHFHILHHTRLLISTTDSSASFDIMSKEF